LTGGTGADTFVYLSLLDAGDSIVDFKNAGAADRIDVSSIDANTSLGGDQGFAWGGTTATANGAWYAEVGGNTILHFDTDGSTGSDELTITLSGIGLGLTAMDFVL